MTILEGLNEMKAAGIVKVCGMVHSTGHTTRLARFTGAAATAAFGGEEYSKEELTAELKSFAEMVI